MNAHKLTQLTIIVACLALNGCASTGAATPTATQPPQPPIPSAAAIAPTEAPQSTATSSPTNIPAPTQAPEQPLSTEPPMPVDTPVLTATSYPAPAVPLSPTGPWLVFTGDGYLWAINQDGTGLTRLTNEAVDDFAIRPNSTVQNGLTIAYDSTNYSNNANRFESTIKLLSWPSGNVKTIVYNLTDQVNGLEWSPSGSKLAFVSAMDDASLSVFVYDVATEQTTCIAEKTIPFTVNIAYKPLVGWSPDERFVIQEELYAGMSGYGTSAIWSARSDAGGVTQLVGTLENQRILGSVTYLGWLSSTEIIVTFDQWIMGENVINRDIRIINIETGNYTTLVREPLLCVAYSPKHNLFLMTKEVAPAPNRLLIFYQNGERREVAGYTIKEVRWLSAYDAFLGQTPDGRTYLISPDGTVTEIPTPKWDTYDSRFINSYSVIVSPNYQWWAWYNSRWTTASSASELWVGPAKAQPSVRLSTSLGTGPTDGPVSYSNVIWSPDSQHLLWLSRKGLFIASPPNFGAVWVTELPGDGETMSGQRKSPATFSGAVWVQ